MCYGNVQTQINDYMAAAVGTSGSALGWHERWARTKQQLNEELAIVKQITSTLNAFKAFPGTAPSVGAAAGAGAGAVSAAPASAHVHESITPRAPASKSFGGGNAGSVPSTASSDGRATTPNAAAAAAAPVDRDVWPPPTAPAPKPMVRKPRKSGYVLHDRISSPVCFLTQHICLLC